MRLRWYRRAHRWIGLASTLVVLVVSATGVLLHHPGWLGAAGDDLVLLASTADGALLRVAPGILERSDDGGVSWQESPLDLVPTRPVRMTVSTDGRAIWLVGDDGLLVGDARGMLWELGLLPALEGRAILDLAARSADHATLLSNTGAWTTEDGGQSWSPRWQTDRDAGRVLSLIHGLHTGHLGGAALMLVYDIAAGGLLILVVTGVVLALRGKKRQSGGLPCRGRFDPPGPS